MSKLKIIDFHKKGNVVRFYLGESDCKPWGDDWDDAPYEHNAGQVYDEYIKDHCDIMFPFEWHVFEPCDETINSRWSKQDMLKQNVPCIVALPPDEERDYCTWHTFDSVLANKDCIKYYFGDMLEPGVCYKWLGEYKCDWM